MYNVPVSIFNHQKRPRQALYADPQSQGSMNRQTNVQPQNKLQVDLMPVQGFSLDQRPGNQKQGIHCQRSTDFNKLGSTVYPPKPQERGRGRGGPSPQSNYQSGQSQSTFRSQGQNAQTQSWKMSPQNRSQVVTSKNTQQSQVQSQTSQMNVSARKRANETPQNNKFGHSINSQNLQQRSGGISAQRALKFGGAIPHNPTPTAGAPAPNLYSSVKMPNMYNTASLVNLPHPATDSKNSVKLEKSVEEKISLNKDLHVITTTIAGVKKWNKYKEQVQLIFEVYGVVDSALVKDSSGMTKEFLLRDEQDSMQCIFYEIDRSIPRLTRGQWHRLLGNFNERCQKFHCVSVRATDQEERILGKRLVAVSSKTMETIAKTLREV
ncbi:hypothetical protein CHS0354_014792 [Potamilus streckersoni]|uniref:Spermatogenesis-associated protein 22 n=1 Tax=Potamilus streckersoni TaxID=2493646 RepID=A0AAE0SQQ0_9BIVA|nr:hypothetical protein CHS0354_014792 [Potamilus streckersoni]